MCRDNANRHPSTFLWIVILSIIAAVLLIINLADTPEPTDQALGQTRPPFAATLPQRSKDAEYTGSASCRECHAEEH